MNNFNSLGVNLTDYTGHGEGQVFHGGGDVQMNSLADLNKALEATSMTGGASLNQSVPGQGAALKTESLESNLRVITFKEQDIRFWKLIPKKSAFSTVEEYNQLESYGADRGGFNNEGELPVEEDSTYVRRAQMVKFLGVTKSVTHQMQMVSTSGISSAIQAEIKSGTQWILRKADRSLAFADSTIIPQEYNGLYAQHMRADVHASLDAWQDSEVVVDLRGKILTQLNIEQASEAILENFGVGNLLMAPPKVLSNFSTDYYDKQRIMLNGSGSNGFVGGGSVKNVTTTAGDVELQHDIFLRKAGGRLLGSAKLAPTAPANPVVTGAVVVPAVANSRFALADAGDYRYGIAAINRYGESDLLAIGGTITLATQDAVDLTFASAGGANPATGFVIYRSKKNDTSGMVYPINTISTSELTSGYDGAIGGKARDLNRFLPDMDSAMLIEKSEDVFAFKQLAPLMKMDLAILSPAYRFMILLYGTPILYAPKKMVRFINIGNER